MEWSSPAIILSARSHGEGHAVLDVLSAEKGRARGYVRGGSSRKQRPILEPGNFVEVTWRGRLDEHLGSFRVELTKAISPELFRAPSRLAALNSLASLLAETLPEREACLEIYERTKDFLTILTDETIPDIIWGEALVRLELLFLKTLGFGLDLSHCAVTGTTEKLTHVSPNTARAVSEEASRPYKDKLLVLPSFLTGKAAPEMEDIRAGLELTGHFMTRYLFHGQRKGFDAARARFLGYFPAKNH